MEWGLSRLPERSSALTLLLSLWGSACSGSNYLIQNLSSQRRRTLRQKWAAEVKKLKLLLVTVGGISELSVTSCLSITSVLVMNCRTLPRAPVSPETLVYWAGVACDGLSHILKTRGVVLFS